MAEREGFEPSYGVTHNTISNRAPSATRTPLHENLIFAIRQLGIPVVQQVGNCKVPAALYLFALVDTNRAEAVLGRCSSIRLAHFEHGGSAARRAESL